MTPTISDRIKDRFSAHELDCGFLMWSRLVTHFRVTGDGELMRLTKEYYTLEYDEFESMTEYLTHIKLLEERIAATKVVLTPDKQTILCLAMSLPDELQ
ncbi:hypothetical protein HO173_003486 [Letharia columbiana]|uniref:Uncharacterized protein n=1 Tax=Letharia columbiana TaxID=112416 RepID=A0A8H6G198_9LECA|nr:uncharacterized protein HO173_003486 [Letharia columbiana]KAF6238517.1 hypothetical protein HO173_003486 [Letharia columbiana]